MAPGVKQAPMFEPKVFRDHIYCVEESTVLKKCTVLKEALATLLGLFGARSAVTLLPYLVCPPGITPICPWTERQSYHPSLIARADINDIFA